MSKNKILNINTEFIGSLLFLVQIKTYIPMVNSVEILQIFVVYTAQVRLESCMNRKQIFAASIPGQRPRSRILWEQVSNSVGTRLLSCGHKIDRKQIFAASIPWQRSRSRILWEQVSNSVGRDCYLVATR